MEKEEIGASTKQDQLGKLHDPMRCAKAAMMLFSLGTRREHLETEMMKQVIEDLRLQLVRERIRRKSMNLCNLMELVLQILLVFGLCTFFLMLGFKSC